MPIRHKFTSAKADGADATLVRPSNWNDDHDMTNAPFVHNLVLNSDFGRRTVWGLAMPEVFADTSAWTGGAPSAASNILTIVTASTLCIWNGPTSMWRDGRWSAQFKMEATAGRYTMIRYVDANNYIYAEYLNGNFNLKKFVGGVLTSVATVVQAGTLNNFYWLELEMQGTTAIAKLWTNGAANGMKSAATLLQTLTGTIADAGVATGGFALFSDQANSKWGYQASGNGGVYVETWLPESWAVTFSGTLGGQAIGYDESADAGPLGKQWAMRTYTPAASRTMTIASATLYAPPSLAHTGSTYTKITGYGGSSVLLRQAFREFTDALGYVTETDIDESANVASWTRRTGTFTTNSTTRRVQVYYSVNPNSLATGTAYFMLPQLEQGSAATAWRNAPADDAPIVWETPAAPGSVGPRTTTSSTFSDIDASFFAANIFLPWDAHVTATYCGSFDSSTAAGGALNHFRIANNAAPLDANDYGYGNVRFTTPGTNYQVGVAAVAGGPIAAGRARISAQSATTAGTLTADTNYGARLRIIATRGR